MSEKALRVNDDITSYPDETIQDWLDEFNASDSDSLFIKDCPFSFYEVRREYLHRNFIQEVREELKHEPICQARSQA